MGQIAQQVALRAQENQKNHKNVNAVTTKNEKAAEEKKDEVHFDDNIIEVELELRENMNKQEEVVSLVKPIEEKTKTVIRLPHSS